MIIFLYGPDSYRSKQKLDEIVQHYKDAKKSGLNLLYMDGGAIDFSDFYDALKVTSMFAEKKLIILKNTFANKKFQEDFGQAVQKLEEMQDVIVVYEPTECDQRLKLFKTLTKACKCQEFVLMDAKHLKLWAQKEFEARGVKVNLDALDLLALYVGNNLWQLGSEVSKLADYKKGGTVRKEDIEMMCRPRIEVDIFKTIDALAQKNKPLALQLIHKHIDSGEAPLYLMSMIAWQFKNLLVVKELAQKGLMYNSIVKKSGLHPFVVKKNYFMCSQFSFDELKNIYRSIFTIDSDIKTGRIEPETALDVLVAKI